MILQVTPRVSLATPLLLILRRIDFIGVWSLRFSETSGQLSFSSLQQQLFSFSMLVLPASWKNFIGVRSLRFSVVQPQFSVVLRRVRQPYARNNCFPSDCLYSPAECSTSTVSHQSSVNTTRKSGFALLNTGIWQMSEFVFAALKRFRSGTSGWSGMFSRYLSRFFLNWSTFDWLGTSISSNCLSSGGKRL